MLPYLFSFVSMLCYAVTGTIGKKVIYGEDGMNSFLYIAVTMGMLSFFALIAAFVSTAGQLSFSSVLKGQNLGWMVALSAINLVGFYCFTLAIGDIPVVHHSTITMLTPIVAAFAAFFLLGENFQLKHFIGITIAMVGVYVAIR